MFPRRFVSQNGTRLLRQFHRTGPLRSIHPSEAGFVFDMDGVLLKGAKPIPKASDALKLLNDRQIPWILMTNGGGISEQQRADVLGEKLGLHLELEQIVQSHTPLKTMYNKHEKTVLVIGGDGEKSRLAAEGYGFKRVLIPADFIKTDESIWPFHSPNLMDFGRVIEGGVEDLKFDNILVFNDPRDFGTDIQVIMDVLNKQPDLHVVFSNDDWLWANDYKYPRFGQGVTRFLLQNLYEKIHGEPMNKTVLGKPTKIAYDYAHHILINRSIKLHEIQGEVSGSDLQFGQEVDHTHLKQVYMIGDNPASDIIGGYNYGWNTGLVKTGVYKDGDELPCKPTIIGDDVYSVIKSALDKMGLS